MRKTTVNNSIKKTQYTIIRVHIVVTVRNTFVLFLASSALGHGLPVLGRTLRICEFLLELLNTALHIFLSLELLSTRLAGSLGVSSTLYCSRVALIILDRCERLALASIDTSDSRVLGCRTADNR
jgi:hypothetical protein